MNNGGAKHFTHSDPQEIFRQFFGTNSPFTNMSGHGNGFKIFTRTSSNRTTNRMSFGNNNDFFSMNQGRNSYIQITLNLKRIHMFAYMD